MTGLSRRGYLSSVAIAGVLAGCSSDETGNDNPQTQPTQDTNPSDGGGSAGTAEEATIEITNTDFILGNSVTAPPDGQIPWAITEVENTSSVPHGRVRTELRFYDSDDTLLESREGYTDYIPPNTVWRDYIRYYTETPDRLDHIETRIVDATPSVGGAEIEEISLVSSEVSADPEAGVELAAEIDLQGATPDRVTVFGLFYDDQGRFRGTVRGVDTNPAETVAVSPATITIRTPPNLEGKQVTSYEVLAFEGLV